MSVLWDQFFFLASLIVLLQRSLTHDFGASSVLKRGKKVTGRFLSSNSLPKSLIAGFSFLFLFGGRPTP